MRFSMTTISVLVISCGIFLAGPAYAEILHVPGDFPTIQAAIDAAMDGDEVEVHPGTYFENINLLGKAVTLRSSDGPDVTTIDAGGSGSVVTCTTNEGPDTVIDGFTITGGHAFGGGMHNRSGSSPTVTNCTFSGNSAPGFGGGGRGGGMANFQDSNPTVTNCTFSGNTAIGVGGESFGVGGGMYNSSSSPTVTNCTFSGNISRGFGGSGLGGGMVNFNSSPTVTNCTFSGNTAGFGGGMFNISSSPTVTNCTFSGNDADNGTALAFDSFLQPDPSDLSMTNCILWDGGGEVWNNDNSMINIAYSDVQDGWPGEGNIDLDPLFVDPDGPDNDPDTWEDNDYRLAATSPCIDAADNTAVPQDITTDLDGNPRFVDDPLTPDTGAEGCLPVDMGAYEYQEGSSDCPCPADFDGDGQVRVPDLIILLAAWGPNPGHPADLDGNGEVRVPDLIALLAKWGVCP